MTLFNKISTYKILFLFVSFLLILILLKERYPQKLFTKVKTALNYNSHNSDSSHNIDNELQLMNNVVKLVFTDTISNQLNNKLKLLIIGNSIAAHQPATNIGWTNNNGMAASSLNNDYPHRIFNQLQNAFPQKSIHMRISNFADFERNPNAFNNSHTDSLFSFQPDIAIFQISENVALKDSATFCQKYIDLIVKLKILNKKTIIICTTPFIFSENTPIKNNWIKYIATQTKSFLVDLSHIPIIDKTNYAKFDEQHNDNKQKWTAPGIGVHPGDKGMANIAEQIFTNINAAINNKQ